MLVALLYSADVAVEVDVDADEEVDEELNEKPASKSSFKLELDSTPDQAVELLVLCVVLDCASFWNSPLLLCPHALNAPVKSKLQTKP